jgi:DNA-binding NtrC family response regulator
LLERHFVAQFAAQYRKELRGLTHRAQVRLAQHSWPGNVRELENVIGHAAMMTTIDMVDVQDFPPYLHPSSKHAEQTTVYLPSGGTLAEVEREYIVRVLRETGGVISTAATRLGLPRTTLNAMMRKLGIFRKDL